MKIKLTLSFLVTAFFCASCLPNSVFISTEIPKPDKTIVPPVVIETSTHQPETILVTPTPIYQPTILDSALSTDGKTLAVYTNSEISLYNTETLEKTIFFEFPNGNYSEQLHAGAVALSPDGKALAMSGKFEDMSINILDIETKEFVQAITEIPNGNFVSGIEFSPDGRMVVVSSVYPLSQQCERSQSTYTLLTIYNSAQSMSDKLYEKSWCNYASSDFRLAKNGLFFLFFRSMTPSYWVYQFDTNVSKVVQEKEYDTTFDGYFYDVSPDGSIYAISTMVNGKAYTNLVYAKTGEKLKTMKGLIQFITNTKFIVNDLDEPYWSLFDGDITVCNYKYSRLNHWTWIDFSENRNAFTVEIRDTNSPIINSIQVWSTENCELLSEVSIGK